MATYTIREVAQRFHVQTSTLRYYEDQGLLCDVERDDAGRRVYTDSHIGRLEAIACFKHAGMSIDELKRFFAYEKDERAQIVGIAASSDFETAGRAGRGVHACVAQTALVPRHSTQHRNGGAIPGLGEL